MTTQADDGAEDTTGPEVRHEVLTSATFGGTKFYLFQLVYTPSPRDRHSPKAWIVTSLEDTLVLADLRFDKTMTLTEDDARNTPISPQVSKTGIPVFGY